MKKEKLIIICVAILAVAVVWSQLARQNSIERQAQMKIDQENKVLAIAEDAKNAEAVEKRLNKLSLDVCLENAEKDYWNFMELNGTKNDKDGSINALTRFWDQAAGNKKDANAECYARYK